jgi:hypothetical protein
VGFVEEEIMEKLSVIHSPGRGEQYEFEAKSDGSTEHVFVSYVK